MRGSSESAYQDRNFFLLRNLLFAAFGNGDEVVLKSAVMQIFGLSLVRCKLLSSLCAILSERDPIHTVSEQAILH